MSARRPIHEGDWINIVFNLLIGSLLGSAAYGLVQIATTAFWPVALFILIAFGGVFLFEIITDRLFEKVLPSGIRPARNPDDHERKPLVRVLSMPVGVVIGVGLALAGVDRVILDMLP